jgi:hypothetical protein
MRHLSRYLSIKYAAFLSLDIRVPRLPCAAEPMDSGLADAVRRDKVSNHAESNQLADRTSTSRSTSGTSFPFPASTPSASP